MKKYLNNPQTNRAVKLTESFTGQQAEIYGKVKLPKAPKIGIAIGEVLGIIYRTNRNGENYIHHFRLKHSRPLLVSSHDGKQLLLIGGSYDFTERGIIDRPKRKRKIV